MVNEGVITGNLPAIKAYRFALNAFRQYKYDDDSDKLDTIISDAIRLFQEIQGLSKPSPVKADEETIKNTWLFFHYLSQIPDSSSESSSNYLI